MLAAPGPRQDNARRRGVGSVLHLPLSEGLSAQDRRQCEAISNAFETAAECAVVAALMHAGQQMSGRSLKEYIASLPSMTADQQAHVLTVLAYCATSEAYQAGDMFTIPTAHGSRRATSRAVLRRVWGDDQAAVWAKYVLHELARAGALDVAARLAASHVPGKPDWVPAAALSFLSAFVQGSMAPAAPESPALVAAINAAALLDPCVQVLLQHGTRPPMDWLRHVSNFASVFYNKPTLLLTTRPADLLNSLLVAADASCRPGGQLSPDTPCASAFHAWRRVCVGGWIDLCGK